jgi:hypothetical protein
MGRGGQRPILVKYVYFGNKLETLINMKKLEKNFLPNVTLKIPAVFFFAIALK